MRHIYQWLFGRGRTTRPAQDGGVVQTVQVRLSPQELMDDRPVILAYGLISSPPVGADVLVACGSGDRSDSVVIAHNHQKYRYKGAQPGESGLHNGMCGSIVLLKANGDVYVKPGSGNVIVDGGTVTADDFITTSGVKLSDHTHGGVQKGGDATEGPQG